MNACEARRLTFAFLALSAMLLAASVVLVRPWFAPSPTSAPPPSATAGQTYQAPLLPETSPWAEIPALDADQVKQRFKLVGTFQTYRFDGTNTTVDSQLALIDDRESGQQHLAGLGHSMDGFGVQAIRSDEVELARLGQTWTLELQRGQFSLPRASDSWAPDASEPPLTFEGMPALETSPFGKRIAENQWVIQRDAIFAYANEILQDERRAAALYASFRTDRRDDKPYGFRLGMEGEQAFFGHMGLKDGDVIRTVNSMQMSNTRRAEYLVSEFMRSRMSAVVLEIERDGAEQKLIYVIR